MALASLHHLSLPSQPQSSQITSSFFYILLFPLAMEQGKIRCFSRAPPKKILQITCFRISRSY